MITQQGQVMKLKTSGPILDRNIPSAELGPDYFHRRHKPRAADPPSHPPTERLGHIFTLQPTQT